MSDSEIYKGWKITQGRGILSDGCPFVAIEIDSPSGRMITGGSVDVLKAKIDAFLIPKSGSMNSITWTPIEEIPEHLKDGRDVLLHYELPGLSAAHPNVIIGGWDKKLGVWVWQNRASRAYSECYQPNFFAEINLPGS